jgi:flagellar L-ring protein precursor FlgH
MTRVRRPIALPALAAVLVLTAGAASATDLYTPGSWPSLASDRRPERPGDSLTVVIYENSTAVNSAQNGSRRSNQIAGRVTSGSTQKSASGSLGGDFDAAAQTERAGKLVAQISVTVESVAPNGDLVVSGEQMLNISGEHTRIHLRGRVRPADISGDNTVLSTRLADAAIDYDGAGFVSRRAGPGVVNHVLTWLGLP